MIARVGRALRPEPSWPDTTYPKLATGTSLVSAFCIRPTGAAAIDPTLANRPGALILPVDAAWRP